MADHRLTYKFRLYPTRQQAALFEQTLGLCQELYNAALQERRDAWRVNRVSVNFAAQSAQLPDIKVARPELNSVYSQVLQDTLHRVDKTFKSFFARVRRKEKAGFPRFRSTTRYDSFTYPQLGFSLRGSKLSLSKIGKVKIKLHRMIEGKIKTLTVKRETGRWYACCEKKEGFAPQAQSASAFATRTRARKESTCRLPPQDIALAGQQLRHNRRRRFERQGPGGRDAR